MKEPVIYYRFGKKYRKIGMWEPIAGNAMMSCCGGELVPISEYDGEIDGMTPSKLSRDYDFFNPIEDHRCLGSTY